MFAQLYQIYPQNLYYIPQYVTPEVHFLTYNPQLPMTYQN